MHVNIESLHYINNRPCTDAVGSRGILHVLAEAPGRCRHDEDGNSVDDSRDGRAAVHTGRRGAGLGMLRRAAVDSHARLSATHSAGFSLAEPVA